MVTLNGASITALSLCLLVLNHTKGEEVGDNIAGNNVWNFFFGGKEAQPTCNCPAEPVTCETRNASVAYVRWGRDDCNPDTSDIVYSGYVGGGLYTQSGAGTNPLCLPETPEYDDDLIAAGSARSLLYGSEFQTSAYGPWSGLHDGDITCAVCLARGRSTTLMIPAKRTCPSGWTKEYGGLLMGSYKDHNNGHDYLCIDGNPQARDGSAANTDGNLFYPTEGQCGSLPCPPYVNGNELSCVVCTR